MVKGAMVRRVEVGWAGFAPKFVEFNFSTKGIHDIFLVLLFPHLSQPPQYLTHIKFVIEKHPYHLSSNVLLEDKLHHIQNNHFPTTCFVLSTPFKSPSLFNLD